MSNGMVASSIYEPSDTKSQRLATLAAFMNARPCNACAMQNEVAYLATSDCAQCAKCDWVGSGSYLHSCKTGWPGLVCEGCNEQSTHSPDVAKAGAEIDGLTVAHRPVAAKGATA